MKTSEIIVLGLDIILTIMLIIFVVTDYKSDKKENEQNQKIEQNQVLIKQLNEKMIKIEEILKNN